MCQYKIMKFLVVVFLILAFIMYSHIAISTVLTRMNGLGRFHSHVIMHAFQRGKEESASQSQLKLDALAILDCLTSPKDIDDPQFSIEKDSRRETLLQLNDYSVLKKELKLRGLRTSGDKLEMMTRLLLHIVDPSINLNDISGLGARLKYIDKEDLDSKKVRIVPEAERIQDALNDLGPDAEDLAALRRTTTATVGGSKTSSRKIIMDGLNRKVASFSTLRIRRSQEKASYQDTMIPTGVADSTGRTISSPERVLIDAYVTSAKDVLKNWDRHAVGIVLLPALGDGTYERGGWDAKSLRILADELAFNNQAVVIVPDISRGRGIAIDSGEDDVWNHLDPETLFDDVAATLRYAREEFSVKAVCLAGVGAGAGRALEISCDLFDAAFEPFGEKLQPLVEAMKSADFGGRNFDSHPTAKAVRQLLRECDTLQRAVLFREDDFFELADPLPFAEVLQSQDDWKEWDMDGSESAITSISDSNSSSGDDAVWNNTDDNEAENELVGNGTVDNSSGEKEDVLAAAGLSAQEIAGLFNEIPLSAASTPDSETQTEDTRTSSDEDKRANPNNVRPNQLVEWQSFCSRIQHIAALASNISSSRSAVVSEYSSLSAMELWPLVPRAVLAITPERFNVSFVGQRLKTPTIIALSDNKINGRSTAEELYSLLISRADEILDFSIRVYEGSTSTFAHRPFHDIDRKCRQDIVSIGSLWLDAYSAIAEDDRIEGIGTTKFTEQACYLVPDDELDDLRESIVATYLHDENSLFQEDCDGLAKT